MKYTIISGNIELLEDRAIVYGDYESQVIRSNPQYSQAVDELEGAGIDYLTLELYKKLIEYR